MQVTSTSFTYSRTIVVGVGHLSLEEEYELGDWLGDLSVGGQN
jgi:hypothetical protein